MKSKVILASLSTTVSFFFLATLKEGLEPLAVRIIGLRGSNTAEVVSMFSVCRAPVTKSL